MTEEWFFLENTFQHYPWGSKDGISTLLNFRNSENLPIAELWMGAHQSAPSRIKTSDGPVALNEAIRSDPDRFLGQSCRKRFGDTLPYLFKVLSAAHPLSIQVHPGKAQARSGFERENRLGIPLTSPERNYRDPNHKPEVILALTPFTAMCGFRPVQETADLIRQTGIRELVSSVASLEANGDYRVFLQELWSLPDASKRIILDDLSSLLETVPGKDLSDASRHPLSAVRLLSDEYPGDIGIVSPLYLNTVNLNSGEALYLSEGILHAYLSGTGIELMANSDNVLRGGLTQKHIDVPELLSVVSSDPHTPRRLVPVSDTTRSRYPSPAEEFELQLLQLEGDSLTTDFSAPTIVLVTHGKLDIADASGCTSPLPRGSSIFIPAESGSLTFSGEGIAYLATVPHTRTGTA
ncbi:MAG: mannose-6-phosphate isomerase, class I [Treponema sp.]|nr:mannose-6-phosphate isomerase, class I [Treponema sp.]